MKDNDNGKARKETHLETRVTGIRETNNRLEQVLERVQNLEIRMSGDRITDLKEQAKSCSSDCEPRPDKQALITDLQDLSQRTNNLITDLDESVGHLEDFI